MTGNVDASEERILDHSDLPMLTKLPIGTWLFPLFKLGLRSLVGRLKVEGLQSAPQI
jgi:hypothetical protein